MTIPDIDRGHPDGTDGLHAAAGQSVGDLMRQISTDLSTLLRQEVALAKAELRTEGNKAGKAAGFFGGAGLAGYLVLLFLSLALWAGLSNVMDPGWAGLVVAVIWAAITAVLYALGRSHARQVSGLRRTSETVRQVPEALKPNREGVDR